MMAVFQSISFSFTMSTENLQRGHAGALAVAGLEHEQLAVLDGELEVLHVPEMFFERLADRHPVPRRTSGIWSFSFATGSGVRTPATTSSPCALMRNSP